MKHTLDNYRVKNLLSSSSPNEFEKLKRLFLKFLIGYNGQSVCAVGVANLSASMIGCANGAYALLREGRASDPSRVKDHYTLAIKEKSDTQGRSPVSRQARSATFSLMWSGMSSKKG